MNNPITRKIENKQFVYYQNNNKVINKDTLARIKKLHIPPKWTNVNVSNSETDYLQATGNDSKGRVQYIYHPVWIVLSKIEKYNRLKLFAKKLPLLMKTIGKKTHGPVDLTDKEYIIALIFRILNKTHSRIGNDHFAEENNTYGLTTLLKKHLSITGDTISLSFVGKKSIKQQFIFTDKICSIALKELKNIPGDRLFKTKNQDPITSNDINDYLKNIMGDDFTAKDFRTYAANDLFLKFILQKEIPVNITQTKRTINECYDEVAEELGNTRAVCRTSYVMPIISEKYMENPTEFVSKKPSLEDIFKLY
jgi:DNA topoisomerase I